MLRINIITIFPEFFDSPFKTGVLGRAIQSHLLKINFVNPRNFTEDVHQSVDDSPFGGGDGMVMKYEPLKKAIEFLSTDASLSKGGPALKEKYISDNRMKSSVKQKVVYLSPQGSKWDYQKARTWAENTNEDLTFICGRYAGIDQRFISEYVSEEISVGDYVLTGGEPAMLVVLDSLSRFMKGTLGNESSVLEESFEHQNLLEAPQWTRPRDIKGYQIPEVVLSGHHEHIENFRYLMSVLMTAIKRPDLLEGSSARTDLPKAIKIAELLSQEELKACGLSRECLRTLKGKR